jgi:hypothetical protein
MAVVVAVIEVTLSVAWNRFYFLNGIPIFKFRVAIEEHEASYCSPEYLEEVQDSENYLPFKVHEFTKGVFGFREAIKVSVEKTTYSSLMRGKLEITEYGEVCVTGLINWFPLFFSMFVLGVTLQAGVFNPVVIIFPVALFGLLGWIFTVQKKRFVKLALSAAACKAVS